MIIPATLDDLVKQIKKAILHKEYVYSSKTYNANYPIVRGYLQSRNIYPLDGGRILKGNFTYFSRKKKSRKIYEFNFIYYINNINVYNKYRDILHGKYFCIHNYYFSLGIIFKTR